MLIEDMRRNNMPQKFISGQKNHDKKLILLTIL